MEEWLDRIKIKAEISDFMASGFPHFLLTIEDSQEFEDITKWLQDLDFKSSIAYLNTDSEVTCFKLLESFVEEFDREHFPRFSELYSELSNISPQTIIKQNMGSQIKAGNSVDFTNNAQTLIYNSLDPVTLRNYYFESRINDFLKTFIDDLTNLGGRIQGFLICRIKGTGFKNLDIKFRTWFHDTFLRKIKDTLFKLLIICEADAGDLSDFISINRQFSVKKLHLKEIIPVAEQYLSTGGEYFCKGAVDNDDLVIYKDFKLKLRKNI